MNVHWAKGMVITVDEQIPGVQFIRVKRRRSTVVEKAIHYTDGQRPLVNGDEVILNTTAVDLSLGSGGYHFVAWKLDDLPPHQPLKGHIMKLRYTPWQFSILSVEEQASPHHDLLRKKATLEGMPVLAGELHSMLPILAASLQWLAKHDCHRLRIAYVMTDGAALPIALSRHVHRLRELQWLAGTVTAGHAYGGDFEAVNVYSGLLAARHVLRADIAIVLMGPGIVGTGTAYGFTGIEQGQIVNAVHALKGVPVLVPRISFADDRERHQGISHHTLTNLTSVIMRPTLTALPVLSESQWHDRIEQQVQKIKRLGDIEHDWVRIPLDHETLQARLKQYPHDITSMGRGLKEDPAFFLGVSSAADVAWQEWKIVK